MGQPLHGQVLTNQSTAQLVFQIQRDQHGAVGNRPTKVPFEKQFDIGSTRSYEPEKEVIGSVHAQRLGRFHGLSTVKRQVGKPRCFVGWRWRGILPKESHQENYERNIEYIIAPWWLRSFGGVVMNDKAGWWLGRGVFGGESSGACVRQH